MNSYELSMQGGLICILPMLNNRSAKLLTIYIALCTPLHTIFVKKEKYHEFQFCRTITNFFHTIVFKLQEYYVTIVHFISAFELISSYAKKLINYKNFDAFMLIP